MDKPFNPSPSATRRVSRMEHNHIFQVDTINGQWDCSACRVIQPFRMTGVYAYNAHKSLDQGGGWIW